MDTRLCTIPAQPAAAGSSVCDISSYVKNDCGASAGEKSIFQECSICSPVNFVRGSQFSRRLFKVEYGRSVSQSAARWMNDCQV